MGTCACDADDSSVLVLVLGVSSVKDDGDGFVPKFRLSARGSVVLYIDVPGLLAAMMQNLRVWLSLLGGSVYVNDSFNPTKTTASV